MTVVLPRGASTPVTVTLSKSTTQAPEDEGRVAEDHRQDRAVLAAVGERTLKVKRLKTAKKAVR